MSDVTIKYKGQSIATMDASGTKTLGTQGKYCDGDIGVEYVKSGGGSTLGTKTITANDTYDASDDDLDGYSQVTVNVPASAVDTGTKNINTNGTHDVTGYASASVSVPASAVDSGTKSIATNGTHDVVGYASASVNVPASAVDSGTKSITANGNNQDVVGYAAVNVNVPNSYAAGDEGKVVSNGALVAQGSDTVTQNGTVDTTLISSLTVNVSGGGGDYVASDWFDMAKPTGAVSFSGNSFNDAAIRGRTGITSVSIPNVTTIGGPFSNCTGLTSVYAPLLQSAGTDAFRSTKVEYAVFPALKKISTNGFLFDTSLKAADFGGEAEGVGLGNAVFSGCTKMNLLILRGSVLWPLNNVGAFNNSPFASGKAGGTIYIPKSLYDHLGDGGSYDYQAATNWSTVYGYGTITWAKIEGSYYETHYADGTAIPSS